MLELALLSSLSLTRRRVFGNANYRPCLERVTILGVVFVSSINVDIYRFNTENIKGVRATVAEVCGSVVWEGTVWRNTVSVNDVTA